MAAFASWLLSLSDMSLLVFDSFLAFGYNEKPQANLVYIPQHLEPVILPRRLSPMWGLLSLLV
jgi:hypothetical protein